MDNFELAKWTEEYELEDETVLALREKGFKSYRSISKLTPDMIKKEFKTLSAGQFLLLCDAVAILQPATAESPENRDDIPAASTSRQPTPVMSNSQPPPLQQPASAEEVMALWQQVLVKDNTPLATQQTPPSDPFSFGSGPHAGSKCRKITDYITNHAAVNPENDGDETVAIGGVNFCVSKSRKISHDKVKLHHYMEGALRVLRELVVEENVQMNQVVNHLNYLIQIACLAQTNTWMRVLSYDTVYRREQHQHGFQWGTGSAFLLQSQLGQSTNEYSKEEQPPQKRPKKDSTFNPASGRPICGRWNSSQGCTEVRCRYEHVCKACFTAKHNVLNHNIMPKNQ